jgi:hypothetical protein
MDEKAEIATVPVDLSAPDLVGALASTLPKLEKGALIKAALARQGAEMMDLRDAQRGITRRRITPEQHAAFAEERRRGAAEAARFYGGPFVG